MLFSFIAGILAALGAPRTAGRTAVALFAATGSGLALGLGSASAFGVDTGRAGALDAGWLVLRLDPLSAVFLMLIGLVGIAAALYGFGYTAGRNEAANPRMVGVMLNVLLMSLCVQVTAANALTFLFAWEVMSLAAYFLVLTEADEPHAISAANWYMGVTHAGFAAIVAMFLLFAPVDLTTGFDVMRASARPDATRNAIFLLALVGFGAKAGLVPLHVWLPLAHPVAPSHVSGLMSGLVVKMGVYGFMRVVLDLLGGIPPWWGGLVLTFGTISACLGVLYALMEVDLKRLLAYSSIENVGIIFMALGAAMMLQSHGLAPVAAVALVAALYHSLNHGCFKALLFMAAGSVLHRTHTRNMERLGGLIKRMPVTALMFLIGALAAAALPPLNGFVSEWLLFQALLGGARIPQPWTAILMPIAVGLLALTGGLAATCFVRAFGITFLAIPRSDAAERAHEAPRSMQAAMALLAVACVALGLAPTLVVPWLSDVAAATAHLPVSPPLNAGVSLAGPALLGQVSFAAVGIALPVIVLFTLVGLRASGADRRVRIGETWGCGRIGQTPRMQYTATAFAEPLRRVFAALYRPSEDVSIDSDPRSRYFIQSMGYTSEMHPWFETLVSQPASGLIRRVAARVRAVQEGSLHLYLLYMCIVLIVFLVAARWIG